MVPERPDTEVTAKPARRRFTAAYKLSVVERADRCKEPGEVGRLRRREGLYSSQLSAWRKAAREGSLQELGKKRGPKPRPAEEKRWREEVRRLQRENTGLRRRLLEADAVAERQAKRCGTAEDKAPAWEEVAKIVNDLAGEVGIAPACKALGVCRSTYYRRRARRSGSPRPRPTPPRALPAAERKDVFDVLCSERFVDRSPAEIFATLLDDGVYLCSERTMYRVLAENRAVRERRPQRSHPRHPKPEVAARGPNQGLVVRHHPAPRSREGDLPLPVRRPRHLQPLRRRLDGRRPRVRRPRRTPDRGDLRQGGRAARCAHPLP